MRRLRDWALRWHWPLLAVVSVLAAAAQVIDHRDGDLIRSMPDMIEEIFLLGILLPVVAGLLLDELARAKKRASIDQANAVDAERYRLSRDVHDSLAQEVSYLHFKLDQLTVDPGALDIDETYRQLDHLRDVAGQAYKRIYDMLALQRVPASTNLPEVLLRHAERIGKRAQFEVGFTSVGEVCLLSPSLRQQLLYIYSEILSNVEKHSGAKHVEVRVDWQPGELAITVNDDGCGFDPQGGLPEHYGLAIMRERAHDIGGQLSLSSQRGSGTEARLHVRFEPCPAPLQQPEFDRWPAAEISWQGMTQ